MTQLNKKRILWLYIVYLYQNEGSNRDLNSHWLCQNGSSERHFDKLLPPPNGIAKIHKLEFKAVRGDLMRFSDIIKKQIKPTETEFNRPKANLSKISICKQNGHLITKANSFSEKQKKLMLFSESI